MKMQQQLQKGSVSLFLVIFSALLTIVIITAFIRIMLQDQMQATANDLSKSALDSANAGVEDAKRAVLRYTQGCPSGPSTNTDCSSWFSAMDGSHCDVSQKVLGTSGGEVTVGNASINQAYTCVKVTLNTDDYVDTLLPGASKIVPLKPEKDSATGKDIAYDTVTLSWFSRNDLAHASNAVSGILLDSTADTTVKKYSDWNPRTPSLMRAQLLQFGSNFNLTSFDSTDVTINNTATLFLRPGSIGGTTFNFTDGYVANPSLVDCGTTGSFSLTSGTGSYGCVATIKLPLPVGATSINDRKEAYLRLLAPYNTQTSFQVKLSNGANPVKFGGVQPKVDSTGRADDQFRRVSTRVQQGDFPYVDAALDITGDLCKSFTVGASSSNFDSGGCNP